MPIYGAGKTTAETSDGSSQPPEYEVTLNFQETDKQETHAGMTGNVIQFDAIVHRPGLPVEEGGAILETTFVIGEKTDARDEMQAWNMKWCEVIGDMTGGRENLVKLLASSPALQQAMTELRSKESEFDGTMLRMSMRLSAVPDPRAQEQAQADGSDDGGNVPTSLGGPGAKLGGALLKKKREDAATKGPQELYTSEVLVASVSSETDPLLTLPESCAK